MLATESIMDNVQKENIFKDLKSMHKERDFSILEYQALHPDATYSEIKQMLNLEMGEANVGHIVANNWDIVLKIFALDNYIAMPEGRAFERAKAYFRKEKKGVETKKDPLDILNDMEAESVKIDQSRHLTIVYGHRTTNDLPIRDERGLTEPSKLDAKASLRLG